VRRRLPGSVPLLHEQNERAPAVYTAAGYLPDGSVRASEFRAGGAAANFVSREYQVAGS